MDRGAGSRSQPRRQFARGLAVAGRLERAVSQLRRLGSEELRDLGREALPQQRRRDPWLTLGLLGVCEENRVELARDVFVFAYERSAAKYSAVRASLGEPDPFRLQYREHLKSIVSSIVRERLDRAAATTRSNAYAREHLPEPAHLRFRVVVETELDALHEGNFPRYQVRPSEFEAWRGQWTS